MYYSFACPKCGTLLSQYEQDAEASWNINTQLEDMVKQHFAQMHNVEEQVMTDEELSYAIKNGMQSSDEKPY